MHRKSKPTYTLPRKFIWREVNEELEIMSNQNSEKEGVLKTSDQLRAAALLSFDIKLIDAVPNKDGDRLVFIFSDEGNAARLASACFLQNRQVGIQTFCDNLRRVRELMFQWRLTGKAECV
jgi:hypothetical protein